MREVIQKAWTCHACGGEGVYTEFGRGSYPMVSPPEKVVKCEECHGMGFHDETTCPDCGAEFCNTDAYGIVNVRLPQLVCGECAENYVCIRVEETQ